MHQSNKKYIIVQFLFVIVLFFMILFTKNEACAAKSIDHYTKTNIENNLPKSYRTDEFLDGSGNIAYISFATYKGNEYRTSVKRTEGEKDYLYCLDYSKHIDFGKNYSVKKDLFNKKLRARLAVAFYHGASKWKELASSQFTTNNTILDYYMTQLVIHALIYKYGDDKSNYGIDYSQISFKKDTGNLKKKTDAFYKFCCNAVIYSSSADFKKFEFKFKKTESTYMYMNNNAIVSPLIKCETNSNNSSVKKYTRKVSFQKSDINKFTIKEASPQYDSECQIMLPLTEADNLEPGVYSVNLSEDIVFNRYLAQAWQSVDGSHISQEIGGLLIDKKEVKDQVEFTFLIGNVTLKKTDSITGEIISDATFQLQQFDDTTGQYIFYKHLTFNSITKLYESGNIYLMANNKNNRFRIIEEKSGANHINNWQGTTFQLTKENYYFEIKVENPPILGSLAIHKKGESITFSDSKFKKMEDIPLSNVKFGLYAKEDIYIGKSLLYPKNKKIADLITDSSGMINVDNLVSGQYYFKEEAFNPLYDIDPEIHSFTIIRNSDGKYNKVSFEILNKLKNCQIQVLKQYYDKTQRKLPLKGAVFGLYAREDIMDVRGDLIIAHDSLVQKAVSNEDGMITFDDLPYGNYYIKELKAPKGYILNDGIVCVNKEDFKYNKSSYIFYCKKEIINSLQHFKLQIKKTGEAFTDYLAQTSDQGEFVEYLRTPIVLQNVEFSLYNKENNAFIAKAVTDEQGVAEYDNIMTGSYYAIESAAPDNYLINKDKIYFDCGIESSMYNPWNPPILAASMNNVLCECRLSILKKGERVKIDKNGLNFDQVPLKGIVFGIYQSFEYTFPSGKKLPKDTCVGYIVTDDEGKGSLSSKLPIGNYYLKELKTNKGYDLDTNIYPFEVKANQNQDIILQTNNNNCFINQLSKASVKIIKTDANTGKKLKNVQFTLYNDKDQIIGVYKTDRKGSILVNNLPYGKYYFIETKCRDGYYSSNDKYRFELNSKNTVVLNITNNPILQLGFNEHYKEGIIICFVFIAGLISILVSGHKYSKIKKGTNQANIEKKK